ncbi:EhSyntaxin B, putative [Entamoeba histolytica HM-3:IMSS]|uniref:EhSyntaxin B, putative n=1 Tax=Entamoeba histolytica HM-3:IMSS TaxID=885315 RepID=M7WGQ8_ENTHI|nr:EhSyntaxin B, putative [Entamoeba histolytica HM-3:IMSS]
MSVDLRQILSDLANSKKLIEGTLSKLRLASKNGDAKLYKQKQTELKNEMEQFQSILERASSVSEDVIEDYPELNYNAKVAQYFSFTSNIQNNIAPPPQQQSIGNAENEPLIGYDDEARLQDQSNLVTEMYADNIQEISDIVTKMKDLNVGFTKLHSLTEVQQAQIDNIEANVLTTDEKVADGVDEISQAQVYQKKASKKLWIILCVAGGIVIVLGAIVTLVCILKFSGKKND